ncbi:type II toxin-antitoxin system Phd/YefM family antitoxin [Candidatus Roizmanbacteria bacterium]|nr:type II toxin-antitoxin system Phd/YefM family antitoxin [Candidatus Roizmanbacteria bacterium]
MKTTDLYITATEARNNFFNLLAKVKKSPHPINITVKGIPEVVVMSKEEYDGWMATIETLSDPELMEGIKEAEKDMQAGRYKTWEEVKKELNINSYLLSDRKGKYVSDNLHQSRQKRSKKDR